MTTLFADAVEAAGRLPHDDQAALIELLKRRLAEDGRRQVIDDVRNARIEFASGLCRAADADEILREALK